MTQVILTLNAGSSSLKLSVYPAGDGAPIATGHARGVGTGGAFTLRDAGGKVLFQDARHNATHAEALATAIDALRIAFPDIDIRAVGHRIVHGGTEYTAPAVLDEADLTALERFSPFAPLHQPHNLAGVRAARAAFPDAPQIGCFDTAFHRNHPFVNDTFALPASYYERGIRRYGFHGLSYDYITSVLEQDWPELHQSKTIIAHLGNGASLCAVRNGQSIASTMGFSALDGLPMGTRCGQIDPGVLLYLMQQENLTAPEIEDLLYNNSGLLGMSGLSHDMRILLETDLPSAAEAIDYYVFRIRREIGAMAAALGGLDGIVFCGGIGENAAIIRARICEGMEWLGLTIDPAKNAGRGPVIGKGKVTALVIPTNEELVIARACRQKLSRTTKPGAASSSVNAAE